MKKKLFSLLFLLPFPLFGYPAEYDRDWKQYLSLPVESVNFQLTLEYNFWKKGSSLASLKKRYKTCREKIRQRDLSPEEKVKLLFQWRDLAYQLGEIQVSQNLTEEAYRVNKKIPSLLEKANFSEAEKYRLLGDVFHFEGNSKKALLYWNQSLQKNLHQPRLYIQILRLLDPKTAKAWIKTAREYFVKACGRNPQNAELWFFRAVLELEYFNTRHNQKVKKSSRDFSISYSSEIEKMKDTVLSFLDKALSLRPREPKYLLFQCCLITAYLFLQHLKYQYQFASQLYQKGEKKELLAVLTAKRASRLVKSQYLSLFQKAEESFQFFLQNQIFQYPFLFRCLAVFYFIQGEFSKAEEILYQGLKFFPYRRDFYRLLLAVVLFSYPLFSPLQKERLSLFLQHIFNNQQIVLEEKDIFSSLKILHFLELYPQGCKLAKQVLEMDPLKRPLWKITYGVFLIGMGKYKKAMKFLENGIKETRNKKLRAYGLHNLAVLYCLQGKFTKAHRLAQRAYQLFPKEEKFLKLLILLEP